MKKIITQLLFIILLIGPKCEAITSIEKGIGARALALGRAFAGQADGGEAIFANPAGLASLKSINLINMYSSPVERSEHLLLGAAFPNILDGTVGLGNNHFGNSSVLISSETVNQYNEETVIVYSRKIDEKLALGGGLKIFLRGLSKDTYPPAKVSGFDIDISAKYSANNWLGIGAVFQNILPESLGGKITRGNGQTEGVQAVYRVGASTKIMGERSLMPGRKTDLFFNLDLDKTSSQPIMIHSGIEWWPVKHFALRGGLDQISTADNQTIGNLTLGFGLKYAGITLDYTYYKLGESIGRAEYYFSLGYVGPDAAEGKTVNITGRPEAADRIRRKHFVDVPDAHWAKGPIEILAGLGIISGYPDNSFKPEKTVTRAELVTMLMKIKPTAEAAAVTLLSPVTRFNDVSPNHWAAVYIGESVDRNVVTGYPDRTFKPGNKIKRDEGAAIMARFTKLPAVRVIEAPYPDIPGRHWAAVYITAAKQAGLLGFIGKEFKPQKALTRAELAEMLYHTKLIKDKIGGTG